ncbi:hypothetical protein KDN32_11370 [Nocardioides sp. J2M5]|uniref:hypothetical protein n=1 Tax=Nocardioides palaemonis TaxID=2829810 RepID=UPI001BAA7563|nr:hypothetical protein [Nocardioides palaemonis]MBS2938342.1 hypothetical protein [Nocardioides palaemonis]
MTAPTSRRLAPAAIACAVILLLVALVVAWSVAGHRRQEAPIRATFDRAEAAPGGLRLFGVERRLATQRMRGFWSRCGAGTYDADVHRAGARGAEVDLVFRPRPSFGGCGGDDQVDLGPSSGIDEGLFVPLEGPTPATVRAVGGASELRVVDPTVGLVPPDGWESEPAAAGSTTAVTRRTWVGPTGQRAVVTQPAAYVDDAPDAWLLTGDLGDLPIDVADAPRIEGDLGLELRGTEVAASFVSYSPDDLVHVRLTTSDGHAVADLDVSGVDALDLRDLVLGLRVRS